MSAAKQRQQNLDALMRPTSVAIVGASDDVVRISGRPLRYLKESGFKGAVLPVNPRRDTVQGLKSYPSIAALPEVPDVAMLAVAAHLVPESVRACAALGVKAVVIFSSGFAETSIEGARAQREMQGIARASGMRLLGPNCLGLFNSALGFYGTFASALDLGFPEAGGVAVASQSGAYGAHVAYLAQRRGLGVRYFVSTGNEADVEIGEVLLWLACDPDVRVIVAYAEGLRDSRTFIEALRIAHERRIPIVMMKVGRSARGAGAIDSHTAALAGEDAVYEALFREYGVHRALTTDEQIDVAYACARGLYPRTRKLGIVTVSGGVGIQTCDAAERYGLDVSPMPASAQAALKALLPYAAVENPVDVTAQALVDMSVLTTSLATMLQAGDYEALLGVFLTVPASRPFAAPLREAIAKAAQHHRDRLIVLCMVADADIVRSYEAMGFLVYEDAYRAVAAIAALTVLRERYDRGLDPKPAVQSATPIDTRELSEHDAKKLLAEVGIPLLPERLVRSGAEAVSAANALGYPVALKIVSAQIAHKTEIGGVLLGVGDAAAVASGYERVMQRAGAAVPAARIDGVLVAPMAPAGVDTIVGVQRDATFGPVVMFGLGGVFVEVLKDVTFRLAPFDEVQARGMIRQVAGHALLDGARGTARADVDALARVLARISQFAASHADDIESIDVNPLRVLPEGRGVVALDALIVPRRADANPSSG
jgi:acetate---CoA ligase (ADP-forming)